MESLKNWLKCCFVSNKVSFVQNQPTNKQEIKKSNQQPSLTQCNQMKSRFYDQPTHTSSNYQMNFQINNSWLKATTDFKEAEKRIANAISKKYKQGASILKIILKNYRKMMWLIGNKYFIVNTNVLEMVDDKTSGQSIRTLYNEDLALCYGSKELKQVNTLKSIQQFIYFQYSFLLVDRAQCKMELSSINNSLKQIKQAYRKYRNNFKARYSQIISSPSLLLKEFLIKQMLRQYLLAIKYILMKYQSISQLKYYSNLKQEWTKLQSQVKESKSVSQFGQKIQSFCRVNAKFIQEESFSYPFGQDYCNQPPQSESNPSSINKRRSIQPTACQNIQQNNQIKYVKLYDTETAKTNLSVKVIKHLKYIPVENQHQRKQYQSDALLQENQMNVIRYLSRQKLRFIVKTQVTKDKMPEKQDMVKNKPEVIRQCFEFTTPKGDKDYSLLYKSQEKNNIFLMDLWNYNSKQIIYSFLYNSAGSIQELQEHFIHQTDLQFQNYIKFGKIFLGIDFEKAFFVKGLYNSKEYYNENKKLFKCWLSYTQLEKLYCLTATYRKYKDIRQKYTNTQTNEIIKECMNECINECMNEMQAHMRENHLNQFIELCKNLFKNSKSHLFQKQQIIAIQSLLPDKSNPLNFSYKAFLQNLEQIYRLYNGNIFPCGAPNFEIQKQTHLICRQFSLASQFVKVISKKKVFIQHIKSMIRHISKKPFKNVCQFQRQIWDSEDHVLVSTLANTNSFDCEIFSHSRYVINFLKGFIMLIIQLKNRGYLLIYTTIDHLVQNGERFILRNIAFLLKIQKQCIINFDLSESQRQEEQLITLSSLIFWELYHFNNKELRKQIFCQQFLGLMKDEIFNYSEGYQMSNLRIIGPKINQIPQFLSKHLDFIHFQLFKQVAESILNQYFRLLGSSQQAKQILTTRQLIKSKNQQNFLQLLEELPEVMNQSY